MFQFSYKFTIELKLKHTEFYSFYVSLLYQSSLKMTNWCRNLLLGVMWWGMWVPLINVVVWAWTNRRNNWKPQSAVGESRALNRNVSASSLWHIGSLKIKSSLPMLANKNRRNSYLQATSVRKHTQAILDSNKGRNSLNQIWQRRNYVTLATNPQRSSASLLCSKYTFLIPSCLLFGFSPSIIIRILLFLFLFILYTPQDIGLSFSNHSILKTSCIWSKSWYLIFYLFPSCCFLFAISGSIFRYWLPRELPSTSFTRPLSFLAQSHSLMTG